MNTKESEALAHIIAGVTDLWDEPLDEVHDVPQIVNAILAAGWAPPVEFAQSVFPATAQMTERLTPEGWEES